MSQTLSPYTDNLVALLNDPDFTPRDRSGLPPTGSRWVYRYFGMPGKTRDRVVVQSALVPVGTEPDWDRQQRFVRCFVSHTDGSILYSGGWSTPAKWGKEWASEFGGTPDEHIAYAEFTRDRGWGYKGDRAKWEEAKAE